MGSVAFVVFVFWSDALVLTAFSLTYAVYSSTSIDTRREIAACMYRVWVFKLLKVFEFWRLLQNCSKKHKQKFETILNSQRSRQP